MSLVFPLKLDSVILLSNGNDSFPVTELSYSYLANDYIFLDISGVPTKVSGYDSSDENNGRGLRITNLCSIKSGELLKLCPKCGLSRNFYDYGSSYRKTNEKRDQSDCEDCRRSY